MDLLKYRKGGFKQRRTHVLILQRRPLLPLGQGHGRLSESFNKLLCCAADEKRGFFRDDRNILHSVSKGVNETMDARTLSALMICCTLDTGSKVFPGGRSTLAGSLRSLFFFGASGTGG
jgi:hypothetical protein